MSDVKPLKLHEINVRTFMRCLFEKNFEGVPNWDELYMQYIDTSGIGNNRQFGLMVAIHNIDVRMEFIRIFINTQRGFMKYTRQPLLSAFDDIKAYGHRLTWNPEHPEAFLQQIDMMEAREKRFVAEKNSKEKELKDLLKAMNQPETVNARNLFVTMLNNLQKAGFKIDRDETDMEALALMIKQQEEERNNFEQQNNSS